ncbi:MAG: cytochrome oxidase Cu insertion factor (SCO1/SenC/PrrC family) [Candidatus Azotimanducaceae bacterium]|jgi:cytochrome oxidase Cu insertion factor (SCO1/SenC/PrrC family)
MTNRKAAGTSLGFIALLMAIGLVLFWFRQVNLVALPQDTTLFTVAFIAAVLLGIASFIVGTRWFGAIPAVGAIIVGVFMTGTIYISPQKVADNPVKVGDLIPHFVALNDDGDRFNSADLTGKPTLIKFFRGHW